MKIVYDFHQKQPTTTSKSTEHHQQEDRIQHKNTATRKSCHNILDVNIRPLLLFLWQNVSLREVIIYKDLL